MGKKEIKRFRNIKRIVVDAKEQTPSPVTIIDQLDRSESKNGGESREREEKYTYGLASLDDRMSKGHLETAYAIFHTLKENLDDEHFMSEGKVKRYQESLAKRGYRLANKAVKQNHYNGKNEELLKYYKEHSGNVGLEKAITIISLLSVVLGIVIGYPALTGNVVAENVKSSITSGAILFVLGLLGVFIANKK